MNDIAQRRTVNTVTLGLGHLLSSWQHIVLALPDFLCDISPNISEMPRISEFYGIAVYMYYRDHSPPHFHAIYGEFEAEIEIASAEISVGELPRRARSLAIEWAEIHRDELNENWELARQSQPLNPIDPLE